MNPIVRQFAPYVLVLLTATGWRACDVYRQRQIGAAAITVKVTRDSLRAAQAEGRKIDSVFRVDTVKLTRRITDTRTLLDTLRLSDTVTLTKRESVLVFVADSLVQQCRQTIDTCSARVANLQTEISLLSQQRDAYRKLLPTGGQRIRSNITTVGIGLLAGFLIWRN